MNDKSKTSTPTDPRFRLMADSMLGRLARWLRLMGYDTTYAATLLDHQIAAQARAEGRIVLTRDRELARRKGIRTLLIDSQILESQIQEVVSVLGPPETDSEPRCPQCNASLLQTTADAVRARVPAHVLEKHQHFCRCSECNKIYWRGSHWQNVELLIAQVLENQDRAQNDNENQSGTSANATE
jgi:uncharacterized protein with PIN domain